MTAALFSICAASTTKRPSSPTSATSTSGASMGWLDGSTLGGAPEGEHHVAGQMTAAFEASQRADYSTALELWAPLAHAGVPRAQNNIGACFAEGLGVDRDPALAARWLALAAEAGDPVGQRNLAALYFKGEGVAQDFARA